MIVPRKIAVMNIIRQIDAVMRLEIRKAVMNLFLVFNVI